MEEQTQGAPYIMRGYRVSPLNEQQTEEYAKLFCHFFKVTKKVAKDLPHLLERLGRFFHIDVVDDSEWLPLTDGHANPLKGEYCVPESVYLKACDGDKESLSTIFHEIGHLFIGHEVVFHNEKSAPPTIYEDSEFQADTFSNYVLDRLGAKENRQLPLF